MATLKHVFFWFKPLVPFQIRTICSVQTVQSTPTSPLTVSPTTINLQYYQSFSMWNSQRRIHI
uniref:Uncharacterized protein n=1 Tax=Anguilla anguilla TaxID=7936 RepID=A0A0E9XNV0_ANGAN